MTRDRSISHFLCFYWQSVILSFSRDKRKLQFQFKYCKNALVRYGLKTELHMLLNKCTHKGKHSQLSKDKDNFFTRITPHSLKWYSRGPCGCRGEERELFSVLWWAPLSHAATRVKLHCICHHWQNGARCYALYLFLSPFYIFQVEVGLSLSHQLHLSRLLSSLRTIA